MTIAHLENFSGMLENFQLQGYAAQGWIAPPGSIIDNPSYWTRYPEPGHPTGLNVIKDAGTGKYWFGGYTTFSISIPCGLSLSLAALVKPNTNNFTIGYRQRRNITGALASGYSFYVTGLQQVIALSTSQPDTYIELVFNRTAKTIETWIDGKFVALANLANGAGAAAAALVSNTLMVGIPLGTPAGMFITDLYINEDLADDGPMGRLGPQDIFNIPLQLADSKDFTSSTLASVLARRDLGDFAGDSDPLVGTGDAAFLKLKPTDGYVLPSKSRLSGLYLQSRGYYTAAADIQAKITRGDHVEQQTVVLDSSLNWASPGIRLGHSSRTDAESLPATALNGLEVALTVVSR